MSDTRYFMGIPVEAEIYNRGRKHYDQKPIEDLYEQFKEAFDAGVKAIRWTQYTPYFNDGEPCYFNVHDPFVTLNDVVARHWLEDHTTIEGIDAAEAYPEGDQDYYDIWDYEYYGYGSHPDGTLPDNAVPDVAAGCYEAALLDAFGDHVVVVVTPDRVVTFEYDHD